MRIPLLVILLALLSNPLQAQKASIEEEFERERRTLSVERLSAGEDASSAFYYLIYKNGAQVRKIRAVWNGGCCEAPTVEDFYFKDGHPVLYVKLAGKRAQVNALARGRRVLLRTDEKFYLKDSKLIMWIKNGKTIPSTDPRWQATETSVLEQFKAQMEEYQSNREEN